MLCKANTELSDIWSWVNCKAVGGIIRAFVTTPLLDSLQILNFGGSRLHGFDFAYQGVEGLWGGLEPFSSRDLDSQLEGLDLAGTLSGSPLVQGELSPGLDISSSIASPFFSSRGSPSDFQGNYAAALNILIANADADKNIWKPTVHSVRMPHRRLALALINFRIDEEELAK